MLPQACSERRSETTDQNARIEPFSSLHTSTFVAADDDPPHLAHDSTAGSTPPIRFNSMIRSSIASSTRSSDCSRFDDGATLTGLAGTAFKVGSARFLTLGGVAAFGFEVLDFAFFSVFSPAAGSPWHRQTCPFGV